MEQAVVELERMTREVAEGRLDPNLLVRALQIAVTETETLANRLNDNTFVTDEASRIWQRFAKESVSTFCTSLYGMLRALDEQPADRHGLYSHLNQALQAELKIRAIFNHLSEYHHKVRRAMATAENTGESVFLQRLDQLMGDLDTEQGVQNAVEFLQNLERLYVLGERQLDTMLTMASRDHEATRCTLELRVRMEVIRVMVEAVRQAVQGGELQALQELAPWLAEQFDGMLELRERVVAACA